MWWELCRNLEEAAPWTAWGTFHLWQLEVTEAWLVTGKPVTARSRWKDKAFPWQSASPGEQKGSRALHLLPGNVHLVGNSLSRFLLDLVISIGGSKVVTLILSLFALLISCHSSVKKELFLNLWG